MTPLVSLRRAFEDKHLLAPVMAGESREPMRAILLASQGEELTESELAHFRRLTERDLPPIDRCRETHIFAGRRSGKSSGSAALAVYSSCLCDYGDSLSPGERGVVLLVAENQQQATVLLNYVAGALDASPVLSKLVVGKTKTSISLNNRIDISVRSADYRGLRGLSLIATIFDEICHWRDAESANPAREVVTAVKPGLMTTKGQLVTIGSPYAKMGYGYDVYAKHFGPQGNPRVIVANGGTRDFNETITQEEIDEKVAEDPDSAASEYLGQWRADISQFVNSDAVRACVQPGVREVAPELGVSYVGYVDMASGSGSDSAALAIGHLQDETLIVDAIRNIRPPFSPAAVVEEMSELLFSYSIREVVGDNYGAGLVQELFSNAGIRYEAATTTNTSQNYVVMLGCINSRKVQLLDDSRSLTEIMNLERRVGFGGKDRISHPDNPTCHDDSAACVAGLCAVVRDAPGGFSLINHLLAYGEGYPNRTQLAQMSPEDRARWMEKIRRDLRGN